MPTLLFRNVSALTMDPSCARARAVLVHGDRIVWVGRDTDIPTQSIDKVIDCDGNTLIPGLNDAHIHFLAYAASFNHLDCSRQEVTSIQEIQRLVQAHAKATAPGHWIRGRGYDETYLSEGRHPSRADLDAAAPHHPVRLDHRSGHACVLNTRALELVGIGPDTPEPPEGVIHRDQGGRPTGLLLEMGSYLSQRIRQSKDPKQFKKAIAETSRTLLQWGITSLQDASAENDLGQWDTLLNLQREGVVRQHLNFMPGIQHLSEFIDKQLIAGMSDGNLRLGPAKIMVTMTAGAMHPPEETIQELVVDAHRQRFPVALHAVEEEVILAVLKVLLRNQNLENGVRFMDRIEHCSEVTPRVQQFLKGSGVTVVTQPGFIYESGERYATQVPQEMRPWLYPLRTLKNLGLPLAAGSDAPVASANPWHGIYGSVTRRDISGQALHPEQSLSLEEALYLYTVGSAVASQEDYKKGKIQPGLIADLVLVDGDLTQIEPEQLLKAQVKLTMVGGEVVWEG